MAHFLLLLTSAIVTWGLSGLGADVSINVSASQIALAAPTGAFLLSTNLFLIADAPLPGGAQPNLRIFQNLLGYRDPVFLDDVLAQTVQTPFVLATAAQPIPEPGSITLLGVGAAVMGLAARRRHKQKKVV